MSAVRAPHVDEAYALRGLRLFNDKADKLDTLSFTKHVFSERIGIRLSIKADGMQVSRFGPDSESIDAFCLTIRYFMVNNEASSFGNLSRIYAFLAQRGIVDRASLETFEEARDLIDVLKQPLVKYPVVHNGHYYSPWEILQVFINGGLAHANDPTKTAIYDQWRARRGYFPVVEHCFIRTLVTFIKIIDQVRPLNTAAMETLSAAKRGSVFEGR